MNKPFQAITTILTFAFLLLALDHFTSPQTYDLHLIDFHNFHEVQRYLSSSQAERKADHIEGLVVIEGDGRIREYVPGMEMPDLGIDKTGFTSELEQRGLVLISPTPAPTVSDTTKFLRACNTICYDNSMNAKLKFDKMTHNYNLHFYNHTKYETYAAVHETTCQQKKQIMPAVKKQCNEEKIHCKKLTAEKCTSSSAKVKQNEMSFNCCEERKNDKQNGLCKKITSFAEKCETHKLKDCNMVKDKLTCEKIKLESGLHKGNACCTWNAKDTPKKQNITTTVSDNKGLSNFKTVTITHTAMENTYPKDLCLKNLFEIPPGVTAGTGNLTRCLGQCQYLASCNSAKTPLTIKVPNVQKLGFLENRYQRASRMYRWGRPKTFDHRYITQGIAGDFIVHNPSASPAQTNLLKYLIGVEDTDPERNAYGDFDYGAVGINNGDFGINVPKI